jgi:hypothetical protein
MIDKKETLILEKNLLWTIGKKGLWEVYWSWDSVQTRRL